MFFTNNNSMIWNLLVSAFAEADHKIGYCIMKTLSQRYLEGAETLLTSVENYATIQRALEERSVNNPDRKFLEEAAKAISNVNCVARDGAKRTFSGAFVAIECNAKRSKSDEKLENDEAPRSLRKSEAVIAVQKLARATPIKTASGGRLPSKKMKN